MQPLSGLTVVALEHAIAAPYATRQLADLGARVIKVERPGTGDFARGYDARVRGLSSHFVWVNRGKESLTLDLKHPAAAALLERLIIEQADVVVQNLAPGAAARLGLSYERLAPARPEIVVCDISGYGASGPYRDKKAYDLLIQAEAGLLSVTGTPAEPCKAGISIADIAAGVQARRHDGISRRMILGIHQLPIHVQFLLSRSLVVGAGNMIPFTNGITQIIDCKPFSPYPAAILRNHSKLQCIGTSVIKS